MSLCMKFYLTFNICYRRIARKRRRRKYLEEEEPDMSDEEKDAKDQEPHLRQTHNL